MNEESKKLIEDLRWEALNKTVGPTRMVHAMTTEELERFAELIIIACAKIADDNYENGLKPVGCDILNHFGV